MNLSLHQQVAVITGAGSGIGYSIALTFARLGAKLALLDIDREHGDLSAERCEEIGCLCKAYAVDVADYEALQSVFDVIYGDLGSIEILVNAAGIWQYTPILETSNRSLDRIMDVNFKGCLNAIKLVLPQMIEKRAGKIVAVASVAGKIGSSAGGTYYAASKGALIALIRSLAREFGEFNININAVTPGVIDTPMAQKIGDAAIKGTQVQRSALKRLGIPEEGAAVIAFLASPLSSFVTGQAWNVCGGYLMD